MALSTKVKINRINNLSDARYTAGMGVEWAGFCLDPTDKECLDKETFNAMTGWISGVKLVGEFGNCDSETVGQRLKEYPVDLVQTSARDEVKDLKAQGLPVILRVDTADKMEATLKEAKDIVDFFLIEAPASKVSDSTLKNVVKFSKQYPIILGFGLDPANVSSIIASHPIEGIALDGGQEIKPGIKDFDHLADILEALEIEN